MKLSAVSAINFKNETCVNKDTDKNTDKKKLTDNFQTKLRNQADMNDCISVPRTIFKGYLGIMVGTSLGSIASLMKPSKAKKAVALTGIAAGLYGTWAFVRPYILKGAVPTVPLDKEVSK